MEKGEMLEAPRAKLRHETMRVCVCVCVQKWCGEKGVQKLTGSG